MEWHDSLDQRNYAKSEKNISPEDLDLFHIVNSTDEAVEIIEDFYNKFMLKPNFSIMIRSILLFLPSIKNHIQ